MTEPKIGLALSGAELVQHARRAKGMRTPQDAMRQGCLVDVLVAPTLGFQDFEGGFESIVYTSEIQIIKDLGRTTNEARKRRRAAFFGKLANDRRREQPR